MTTLTSPSPTISPQPSAFHGTTRTLSTTLRRPLSPQTSFDRSASKHLQQQLRVPPSQPSSTPSSRLNAHSPAVSAAEPAPTASSQAVTPKPQSVDVGTQYTPPGYPPTARWPHAEPAPVIGNEETLGSARQRQENSTTAKREPNEAKEPPEPDLRKDPSPRAQHRPRTPAVKAGTTTPAAEPASEPSPPKRARPHGPMEKELPRKYAECDVADLGILISDMLMDLVRINDKIPLKDGSLTRFHSRAPPGISVKDYLNRLVVHATLSPPILLSMVYYIDRLCVLYPGFTISSLTVHRFLIAAATVAAKGLSDSFWTNNTYARVGGVSVKELALLELDFLEKMQWRIVPPAEVLDDYYRSLVERNPGYRLAEE